MEKERAKLREEGSRTRERCFSSMGRSSNCSLFNSSGNIHPTKGAVMRIARVDPKDFRNGKMLSKDNVVLREANGVARDFG
ncbi:hypothetical protein NL676_013916 [Syzygium grande]|nr:hypothetical protein NL676_013916 [Syzygium grande]